MWNLPAPPDFVGFDPARPTRIYERNLPHWRQADATYFTTFRLDDSLPAERVRELADFKARWEAANPPPHTPEQRNFFFQSAFNRVEDWLDAGVGECILRESFAADIVEAKLQRLAGVRYELGAYVIMPNHVHALVRPYSDESHPLESIEQGWKGFSSREIQAVRGTHGPLWQAESYDRIMRDEEHLWFCLQYIGDNPRRAGLTASEARRWINPAWVSLGWDFLS